MSEEIAATNHLLIEQARLRSELASVRNAFAQQQQALEAERAARAMAEADNAALLQTLKAFGRVYTFEESKAFERLLTTDHPGAALLSELAAARDYVTRLRRWGSRLLRVIDSHPSLIPVYASSFKWRIDGPPPPAETDDPSEVALLQSELESTRAVVAAAREWMDAVETLGGVYAAEQALIATLKARGM